MKKIIPDHCDFAYTNFTDGPTSHGQCSSEKRRDENGSPIVDASKIAPTPAISKNRHTMQEALPLHHEEMDAYAHGLETEPPAEDDEPIDHETDSDADPQYDQNGFALSNGPGQLAESLLPHLLRNPELFRSAQAKLSFSHLTQAGNWHLAELWDVANQLVKEHGVAILGQPDWRAQLEMAIRQRPLSTDATGFFFGRASQLGFFEQTFGSNAQQLSEDHGKRLLQQFLYRTSLVMPLRELCLDGQLSEKNPTQVVEKLQSIVQKYRQLSVVTDKPMFMTPQQFAQAEFKLDWLIPKVLVAGQACIVGGPSKTLKTSIMIDLAVSLGAGSPARFLGKFSVAKDGIRVGFISGESGGATIKEIFRRVCAVRGSDLPSCSVYPEFRLPRLSQAQELQHLTGQIRHHGLQVIIIDPIYLSLLAGNAHAKATNLFDMGPLLKNITESCLEAGATPILVHHTTKRLPPANSSGLFEPIDLEDLAMSGFSEFARQWMLINRRKRYQDGSGEHELYVRIGGSAGFNNLWAVDIDEGKLDEDFNGRKWIVTVSDQERLREIEKEQQRFRKEQKTLEQEQDLKKQLLAALATFPNGETGTALKEAAGLSKNTQVMHLLNQMVREGLIATAQIEKSCGKQMRSYPGFRSLQGWGPTPSVKNATAPVPGNAQELTSNSVNEIMKELQDES